MSVSSSRVNVGENTFPPKRNYMLLTLRDLLEARHHYHVHLAHLPNVVGTAVGRYLLHDDDWYATHAPTPDAQPKGPKARIPRTLFNSVVQAWSWPCVLVFVNQWEPRAAFRKHPDRMVPRALYLPDGRVIPTCTVLVEEENSPSMPDYHLSFANSFIGGGYLTFADVQGQEHIGSIGCLVSDGDLTYALTNRHVTGAAGREMYTSVSGKRRRIGVSDANQVGLKSFTAMYTGWPGENVQLHIDLTPLAQASGIETPTRDDLARLDRKRKKTGSNDDWTHPDDPDAKITKMKDHRTHLAHKPSMPPQMSRGQYIVAEDTPNFRWNGRAASAVAALTVIAARRSPTR